ncbi:MAG: CPXCG motif-containing cysteine-rich protein [Gemmatimonadales bacterium]
MVITRRVACPYCGETFEATIDISAGSQEYTEDCYVCCRPIAFHTVIDLEGNLAGVKLCREDD